MLARMGRGAAADVVFLTDLEEAIRLAQSAMPCWRWRRAISATRFAFRRAISRARFDMPTPN